MKNYSQHNFVKNLPKQRGFSLVEIMIGMVLGLIATLVIVNVFSVFEQQKRNTTGNSDAQTNGAIALFNIQRDAEIAGYGLPVYDTEFSPFLCGTENDATAANITTFDHDANPATPLIGLSPVVILDGGINGSDEFAIRSGDSSRGGIPMKFYNTPADTINVDTNLGCAVGDVALMVSPNNNASCQMVRVQTAVAGGNTIQFQPNAAAMPSGGKFACLGRWNEFRYTVLNNRLMRSGALNQLGNIDATPVTVVSDVVMMQAQYGISNTANSNIVTQWVNPTAAWETINNVAARNRIKAIRIAVVTRNGLLESTNVTATCSSLSAPMPTGLCAWAGSVASPAPAINLQNADWRRYRYRVYESIIPLRNVIWSGSAF